MNRLDNDLLSVQETRILAENAREAQKQLAMFPQRRLDGIVRSVAQEMRQYAEEWARQAQEETGFGCWQDKYVKNIFVSETLPERLQDMPVVGVISEDRVAKTIDIGVPVGVIAALPPATNPVSTTIYTALIAIKSGNAVVFAPHPRARKIISRVLDVLIRRAEESGLPAGAISYLHAIAPEGAKALMRHKDVALLLLTGVPSMLPAAQTAGKPLLYGGPGNGPAFIERTADIPRAVRHIIASRTFDNGIVFASEQSVVAEACIADQVRQELRYQGGFFMAPQEAEALGRMLFRSDGRLNVELVGRTALELADRIGLQVPPQTQVLLAEQKYVSPDNPYAREKLCPVLAFFVEQDWMYACEKCIELLVNEGRGHTLTIHSQSEEVIREFALKKPVSRLLVNTPATLGGIGMTTNLFPAMMLGTGAAGGGASSDNISPLNLINVRKVGYGVREPEQILKPAKEARVLPMKEKSQLTPETQELSLLLEQWLNKTF